MMASHAGSRYVLMVSVLALLLSACHGDRISQQYQVPVFGTLVDVSVHDADRDAAAKAIAEITQKFEAMHSDWHAWKPGTVVELNQAIARGQSFTVNDEMATVIAQAKILAARSQHLFNPAIGKLIGLWGFHADVRPSGPPPAAKEIQALVKLNPRMDNLEISGNNISSSNPAVQLDFGGFAKGVAVDFAIAILRKHGINNAIVNGGGDLRAIGRHGDRRWRVGVRQPGNWDVVAVIETRDDESVFTSGNYERYREHMDRRYAHIIDPRDGMPVEHVASVTVIHKDGATADAAATALVVAGVKNWERIARNMGIRYAMMIDDKGTVYTHPAMLKRLEFAEDSKPKIVLGADLP